MTKYFFENFQIQINKIFVLDITPWNLQKLVIDYSMFLYCRKNYNPSVIRSNFLYTISRFHNDFTSIYTDESKSLLGSTWGFVYSEN